MGTTTYEAGTVVHVSPEALSLTRNIREAKPDKGLIASVKHLGVLEPISAVVTDDGGLLVRRGQRRTLAAIDAGCKTVPVYVIGQDSTEQADEVIRVIGQRDENTHRQGLTTDEEVGVVETLTGMGLSAAQIAKKARIPRPQVDAAQAVAGSELARKAAARYDALTLDQAQVVAEFEDDAETVKALIAASATGMFDHVAQQARDARTKAEKIAQVTKKAQDDGLTVIDRPGYDDKTTASVSQLLDENGDRITVESHGECPGHVAWVVPDWGYADAEGNVLPDDLEADDEDEDSDPYADAQWVQIYRAEFGCQNYRQHGHTDRWSSQDSGRTPAAEKSEEEREADRQQRRLVRSNNEAWDSAETVRREWLATFAKSKTAPKGTARFLADAMHRDPRLLGEVKGNHIAAALLGKEPATYGHADLSAPKSASEARCLVLALIQVLACYEADTDRGTWRHDGTHNAAGRYLRFIERCGYTLSEVEQYAISDQRA